MVKNKFFICKEYHIQPSEIDRLQFYEYEMYIEEIHKYQKDEEKRQKDEEKKQKTNMPSMNGIMRSVNSNMPKFSMPKL